MRKITALGLLLTLASTLTFPALAAARLVAPPGLPEAEQYYETVPTSTGPREPDLTKKAHEAVRDGVISEGTRRTLDRRGPGGEALGDAIAQTAPEATTGGSRPPALGSLGEQGLGPGFLLLIAAMGGAAIAFGISRRRHPSR
jgi:hypothetical protein